MTAEYKVTTQGRGRTVEEWKVRPEHPDNHWLDCLVGCAVGALMLGVSLLGEKPSGERRVIEIPEHLLKKQHRGPPDFRFR
ncbi:MAG: terminase gpA endonuclease subunit [Planctomycetaceae bacterium]